MLDATGGGGLPPDLSQDPATAAAAAAAGATSKSEYTSIINVPLKIVGKYNFWFTYLYSDPDTGMLIEGPRSPIFTDDFAIPNLTKPVQNLTLTAGYKAYSVKFTVDPASVQEDIVIYESLTGAFAGEEYVVYIGTSTNVTIQTNSTAPRWVKVRARDKWKDDNVSDAVAGPVTPLNPDPDTSTPSTEPTYSSSTAQIDPLDKSGFSGSWTVSWVANSDTNTAGYAIRWTTDNPATVTHPLWEYGQVEGKTTTSFTITGLLPNTVYYWQITGISPYNAISWTGRTVRTFGPIVDSNAPADVWAQLRSILSIGGKTADLFKIGTGISQAINVSTNTTASMQSGTYSGIILNKSTTNLGHNYWLNTGQFRVGSASSFLYWDGSDLYTTGKINATGGSFSGDVQLSGGSLYAGSLPNSGQRVRLNSSGIFAYNSSGTQTFSLDTAGYLNSTSGLIGGWTIGSTTLSSNNVKLDNTGVISLGSTVSQSVYLSSVDATYRLWAGSQSASVAPFRVSKDGVLTASGAVISGTLTITAGTTYDAITNATTTANTAKSTADTAKATADSASSTATAASTAVATKLTKSAATIADSNNNITAINAAGITIFSNNNTSQSSVPTSGARLLLNSAGIAGYNSSGVATFTLSASDGSAYFNGTVASAANIAAGGTLSGSDINIGSDTDSYRFRTSYIRANGPNVSSLGINAIGMISTTSAGSITAWYPYYDASYDLGAINNTVTYYWRNLRYTGSLINSSDVRTKTDIEGSDLGLDFINLLRPVKYRRIYEPKAPTFDENGNMILDEKGARVVDESQNYVGTRHHYGLIAQEVKAALDEAGVGDDFSGWALSDENDPDSRQGLSYVAFIAPLIKSVQELSNMVKSLQQEVNTLKGI